MILDADHVQPRPLAALDETRIPIEWILEHRDRADLLLMRSEQRTGERLGDSIPSLTRHPFLQPFSVLPLAQHLLDITDGALHAVTPQPLARRSGHLGKSGMRVLQQEVEVSPKPLLHPRGGLLDTTHAEPLLVLLAGEFHRVATLHALSSSAADSPISLEGNG